MAGYQPVGFVKSPRMSIPESLYNPFELSALMKVIDVSHAGGASPKGASEFDGSVSGMTHSLANSLHSQIDFGRGEVACRPRHCMTFTSHG